MTYRNDLEALSARQAALETEVRDRQRELAEARRLVEEIEARARLPVLDNIRVAAPCAAAWDQMAGDDRVRACGDCQKNVYNLSDLTRDEAKALIVEKEGRLCVRYFQRADGTILLKDCAVGVKRRRRRRVVAVGVAASLAGAALAYVRPHEAKVPQAVAASQLQAAAARVEVQVVAAAAAAVAADAAAAETALQEALTGGAYVQGVMLASTANEQAERLREQLRAMRAMRAMQAQLAQRKRERSTPDALELLPPPPRRTR